jgi:YggT family protein
VVLTIVQILQYLITIYIYILIAAAILSWLIAFDIVNRYNQYAQMFSTALYRLTEPPLRPIRNLLPNLGGIDISPVILIIILIIIRDILLPKLV